ncbi:Ctr copper transporter family-domain-containing protein [Myxozyma melibiosi]|uniref:Copper transport protein n=1 Tax=Myxozyma melibiosi TaxID=54550 RepID=A0ABR1F507_9ASCO
MDMSGMDMGTSSSMDMDMDSTTSMVMAASTTVSSLLSSTTSMVMSATSSAVSSLTSTAMAMTTSSSMDMDMDMSSTSTTMDMDMSTTTSSMDMSSTSSSMDMTSMSFHANSQDFLLATGWTPSNRGQYVGACIFLIVLAVIYRATHVIKHRTERYLVARARVNAVPAASPPEDSDLEKYVAASGASTSAEQRRQVPRPFDFTHARPWRVSIDVPLSVIQFFLSAISYLLMLAAMSFNLGYFFSILGGILLGELLLGRFASSFEAH